MAQAVHPQVAMSTQSMVVSESKERIQQTIRQSRQILEKEAKSNPQKVLDQFDDFSSHLLDSYIKGEGMIEEDVQHIIHAVLFAAKKHRSQTRKNAEKTSYIVHPIGVADQLLTIGQVRDPDIMMAALLHDTVEDTQTTFEELAQLFGPRVAGFVNEVTDDKSLAKQERKRLQIEHAPGKSAGAAQIKLSDKLYNLKDLLRSPPADWDQERIQGYFDWAGQVVDRLPWVNAPLKNAVDQVLAEASAKGYQVEK